MRIFRRLGLAAAGARVLGLGVQPPARGDVKVPAIFGSHMVLQRDQKDRVWGWAEPGEDVTVKIGGQSHATKAGADGSWQVDARPDAGRRASHPFDRGQKHARVRQVLVGEVWICSGQSNMQWSVGRGQGRRS